MGRFFGRTLAALLLMCGISITTLIALYLMALQLAGHGFVHRQIGCVIGITDECLREELTEQRKELEKERKNLMIMRKRNRELEATLERLKELDHAASSYVVFYNNYDGPKTVITGHRYASLTDPSTLTGGWCYIQNSSGAVQNNVYLTDLDRNLKLTDRDISNADLNKTGLSRSDVEEARERCTWPKGVA